MRLPDSAVTDGIWASVVLVQVTLVALLGCLAWLAARRGRPALRGAIVLAALVALLLAPSFCLVVPVWMPLPEWVWRDGAESLAVEPSDGGPTPLLSTSADATVFAVLVPQPPAKDQQDGDDPAKQADETDATPEKAGTVIFKLVSSSEEVAPPVRLDSPTRSSWTWAGLLTGTWLLGATVGLFRALVRLALLYRCSWKARPVRKCVWMHCLASLTRRHGQAKVALRESRTLSSPLTLGLFRPVILLPRGLRRWSAQQRISILEHELAHIRRCDFLAGLVAELAVCLCWFHPLVRWLAGRLRLEQEFAADACVASARTDPTEYLRCLAQLALELERGPGPLAPAFWRRRPEIMRRIDMLRRNPKGLSTQLGKRTGFAVAVLAAAICLAVSGIGPLRSNAGGEPFNPAVVETTVKATTDAQGDPLPDGALARLGTMRMRHGAEVTFVAFGPRGETLLTAGRDSTIRLWDLKTGKEVRRFARPMPAKPKPTAEGEKVKAQATVVMRVMGGAGNEAGNPRVALSPDGKILAVGGGNVIQLYDVETGAELRQIEGPAQGAASLLFAPDGRTLAARTTNGTLLFWETDTGKEIRQIKPAPRPKQEAFVVVLGGGVSDPPGMAFTPDGKVVAAASTDFKEQEAISSVKLWDLTTGKEIRRINPTGNNDVSVVAISPDGEVLAYGDINTIHLCELKTGRELRQLKLPGLGIATLRFADDGKTLAVRSRDQRVSLWDAQTGKEIRLLNEAQPLQQANGLVFFVRGFSSPEARALAISQDGKYVASTSGSTVRLWEITSGKELQLTEGHRRTPIILALSHDGKTVVSWGDDRVVRRWDAASGKSLGAFPAPPGTTQAALSADGRTVAFANADNTIRLHDAATGKELQRIKSHANGIATLAFTLDGKMLASRGSGDNSIRLYDVDSGGELRQFALRRGRNNTDGTRFRVVSLVGSPRVAAGAGLAFTPDNKLLVVPGPGKTLLVFDVATGKELRRIQSQQSITSLAISPDGRTLAAEDADQTISLWEIASGKLRGRLGNAATEQPQLNGPRVRVAIANVDGRFGGFNEPAGPVGLAFSNDGRVLAARNSDQSVRILDVNTGKEIGRLKGHQGSTQTVAFAPDDRSLASGATDTTILLWDTTAPMKALAKEQTVELSYGEMETRWSDLAGDDAAKAFQSVLKLSAVPRQAASFLGARLKPAARIDPRKIDGWVADLESEKYSVRQDASASLLKTGEQALPALRQVLGAGPRLETRKRVEELVLKLTDGNLSTEQLQLVRSIEVLERIGSEEARRILRTLAQGAPATLPTREAEAALKRLAEHSPAQH
jgi:WD40 repeat protein/beta-lactamase regulating signal transducer with metallopeptidase domain